MTRAVVVVAGVLAFGLAGCASTPHRATAEGCARARLAREWATARPESYVGCWRSPDLPGVVVLTDIPVELVGVNTTDEPPLFTLTGTAPVVDHATLQTWEPLAPGLLRLTWSTGFSGLMACVESDGEALVGEMRVFTANEPLPSAPRPLRLERTACP